LNIDIASLRDSVALPTQVSAIISKQMYSCLCGLVIL